MAGNLSQERDAIVLGVGMTPFLKPRKIREYPELGYEAGVKAMLDAGINYDDVQIGVAACGYLGSTAGQRVFYQFGMTGIPIYNTRNACATGSSGLQLARTLVRHGVADCILVVGFEQMAPGKLEADNNVPSPVGLSATLMEKMRGRHDTPQTAQFFANAGKEYMERFGAQAEDFAEIARVSHAHSKHNPYAQFKDEFSLAEILSSPMIHPPLTKLQCSPTSDGAAAAVVVSRKYLENKASHLMSQAVLMAGQSMLTDDETLYSGSSIDLVGYSMTQKAARAALRETAVSASDVAVCELHDCFSANELILLDALEFCEQGLAHHMVRRGDITFGGKGPLINPSGGLISKGHPLGATGLAQCAELVWQLRGWANNRMAEDCRVALQHNLGLGGVCVVTVYKRIDGRQSHKLSNEAVAEISSLGYNPAVQARFVTKQDGDKVRSRRHRVQYALGDTLEKIEARL